MVVRVMCGSGYPGPSILNTPPLLFYSLRNSDSTMRARSSIITGQAGTTHGDFRPDLGPSLPPKVIGGVA